SHFFPLVILPYLQSLFPVNAPPTPLPSTLSLHDALPISHPSRDNSPRPAGSDQRGGANADSAGQRLPQARSMERNQARRRRMRQAPQRVARRFVALPSRMSPGAAIVVILVVSLMAPSLATPLRN